jgi:mannose-6-phosphate isomerase
VAAKSSTVRLEQGSAAWVSADDGPIRLRAGAPAKLFRVAMGI